MLWILDICGHVDLLDQLRCNYTHPADKIFQTETLSALLVLLLLETQPLQPGERWHGKGLAVLLKIRSDHSLSCSTDMARFDVLYILNILMIIIMYWLSSVDPTHILLYFIFPYRTYTKATIRSHRLDTYLPQITKIRGHKSKSLDCCHWYMFVCTAGTPPFQAFSMLKPSKTS